MLADTVTTLPDLLRRRAERSGSAEAYRIKVDGRWRRVTWAEQAAEAEALGAALAELGFGPGDTAAILGETNPTWCAADLAALMAGGRVVGIYPTLLPEQVEFIVRDAGAKVLFVDGAEHLERVRGLAESVESLRHIVVWNHEPEPTDAIISLSTLLARGQELVAQRKAEPVEVQPDDVALIVYTSGTTGRPKGVPLTHASILAELKAGADLLPEPITEDDITMAFLPMAHVAEHVPGFFGRINLGLRAAYATSLDTVIDELSEVRPTYFGAVPRIFEKMYGRIQERVAKANPRRQAIFAWAADLARSKARSITVGAPFSLRQRMLHRLADRLVYRRIRAVFGGRVKSFITGAAPINVEILEFFYGAGFPVLEVYGLSETCAIATANAPGNVRLGSVGKPLPGVEIKIASDGEVLIRGEMVFGGYLNLPETRAETFDDEGFFRSGDIGRVDEDGFLWLTDRKKSLIKTAGGKYVAPARLESLVKDEPLVSQVYVHGDNRPYVVALITLDERETARVADELGVDEAALPTHPKVLDRLARAVERANERLARFEQIKRHGVLESDFSIEEGTLTPTLKIKRKAVAERHADAIAALYAGAR